MGILEKMRLDNRTAFVTGGARGIGKSIAAALAECGANVAIADIDGQEASATAAELETLGVKAVAVETDVTSPESVEAMMRQMVDIFGGLDIAFCNAGICLNVKASEQTFEEWKKVIDVNLHGVFLTAQAAGRQMIKQGRGGSIINTASMSAHIVNSPQPQCAYNASKAAVIQLTKSLAVEWAEYNIRVNSISPGYIGTELTLNSPALKPLIEEWNRCSPVHRMGRPDELQAIAVYLAGDASSFTTGSDFIIDGAFTCV
ncbi:MAG: SDR family oxidoreductase [Clostridiales bacterium]|jgi:NAD(P)-dependent dehydrogenase (short-subunit alcohol dehydrogenase family)|nr:SDR family oxidoreductase [Clostridiales bacterium]